MRDSNPLKPIEDENLNTFTSNELIRWYYLHCKHLNVEGYRREEIFFDYLDLPIDEKRSLLALIIQLNRS